jgi:hypothetical protein
MPEPDNEGDDDAASLDLMEDSEPRAHDEPTARGAVERPDSGSRSSGGRRILRRRSRGGRWLWWSAAVAITLAAIVTSVALGGHRRDDTHLDALDEGAHYSYVVALRSGHLPAWGDALSPQERNFEDCLTAGANPPARCGRRPPSAKYYPGQGYDYEAQQPPLGYLPYLLTANPQAAPVAALSAARQGGIIWVVISGALLLVLALLENLSLLALSGLLLTCLLNPVFTYSAATVNNDAAGIAAGAVALIAWSWSRRRPGWSLPLGIAAGVLVGLTKGQYIAVPLALVIAAIVEEGRGLLSWSGITGASRRHRCAVVMFTAAVVAFGGFSLVQGVRASVPSSQVLHALMGFSQVPTLQPNTLSQSILTSFTLFQPYYPFSAMNVIWGVCAFGVLIGFWFLDISSVAKRVRGLSLGILVGTIGLAAGSSVVFFIQGHYNLAGPVRYEICLLPLIGFAIVTGCRRFGLVTVGIVLPCACAVIQLVAGKY